MSHYLKSFFKDLDVFKSLLSIIFEKIKSSASTVKEKEVQYLVIKNQKSKQDFLIVCDQEYAEVAICVKPSSKENNTFSITLQEIKEGKSFSELFFYSKVLYLNRNWPKHAKFSIMSREEVNDFTTRCEAEKDLESLFEYSLFMLESMNIKLFMLNNYYVLSGLLNALNVKDKGIWSTLLSAHEQEQKQSRSKQVNAFMRKSAKIHQDLLRKTMENSFSDWTQADRFKFEGEERNDMDNFYYALKDENTQARLLLLVSQNHDVLVYQDGTVKAVFYATHSDYGYEKGYSDYSRFSSWSYMRDYVYQTLSLADKAQYALTPEHLSKGCAYLEVNNKVVHSEYELVSECFAIDTDIY